MKKFVTFEVLETLQLELVSYEGNQKDRKVHNFYTVEKLGFSNMFGNGEVTTLTIQILRDLAFLRSFENYRNRTIELRLINIRTGEIKETFYL